MPFGYLSDSFSRQTSEEGEQAESGPPSSGSRYLRQAERPKREPLITTRFPAASMVSGSLPEGSSGVSEAHKRRSPISPSTSKKTSPS